jgi:hypothetical protein
VFGRASARGPRALAKSPSPLPAIHELDVAGPLVLFKPVSLPRRVSLARKGTHRSTKTNSIIGDIGEPFRNWGAEVRDHVLCRLLKLEP